MIFRSCCFSDGLVAMSFFLYMKTFVFVDTFKPTLSSLICGAMFYTVRRIAGIGRDTIHAFNVLDGSLSNAISSVMDESTSLT